MPGDPHSFYEDNPTYTTSSPDGGFWKTSTPEAEGLDASALNNAASQLKVIPSVLSFLVIRHGLLVKEQYFHGSAANHSNNIHSGSKSIISALVGLLLEHGFVQSLDETLGNLLPGINYSEPAKANIKLRDLLTMTAGFDWVEDQTEYDIENKPNWVQAIVDLPLATPPGDVFHYCTGQSHIVSAIITATTKMSTAAFADQYLFKPLGVTVEHWGHDPQCVNSGGYNVYMSPRALAKFAQLILKEGEFNGQPILPKAWVQESLTSKTNVRQGYDYGYYWWLTSMGGLQVKKLWGYGGQLAYVIPSADMVVVITNDTQGSFPEMDGDDIVADYVVPAINGLTQ